MAAPFPQEPEFEWPGDITRSQPAPERPTDDPRGGTQQNFENDNIVASHAHGRTFLLFVCFF